MGVQGQQELLEPSVSCRFWKPTASTQRQERESQLGLSRIESDSSPATVSDLDLQIVQALHENVYATGLYFVYVMLKRFKNFNNIIFSDEAHFHLDGYVDRQNCRFWGEKIPQT